MSQKNARKVAQFIKKFLKFWKNKSFLFITFFLVIYLFFFWMSPLFLKYCEKIFDQKLVYFQISEPVVSLLKLAFVFTFLCFFPIIWYFVVIFIEFVFSLKKKHFWLFVVLGWILFYTGAIFAYKITLPYGIKFLISFKTKNLKPAISLGHFVNFFSFFILAFGIIFELPLIMCFLALGRLFNPGVLKHYRKEIFFCIVVIAAIVTPTPDAFNMSLLAVPLYLLFELGLFLSERIIKVNTPLEDTQKEPQTEKQPSQGA